MTNCPSCAKPVAFGDRCHVCALSYINPSGEPGGWLLDARSAAIGRGRVPCVSCGHPVPPGEQFCACCSRPMVPIQKA